MCISRKRETIHKTCWQLKFHVGSYSKLLKTRVGDISLLN